MTGRERRTWRARAQRFRNMAAECRRIGRYWDDPDIQTSFANAAAELETAASAILERVADE